MRKRTSRSLIAVLTLAALGTLAVLQSGCKPAGEQAVAPEKIIIAYVSNSGAVLMHIAFKKGFLAQEGLDVTPQPHAFGKLALEAVIEGKADLATVGDTPIMLAVMNGRKITALATIQTSNLNEAIVARKNRGIAAPGDLRGKIIGVTPGTTGDFFANSFLLIHGIDREHVTFVNMKPDEMSEAIHAGKVDAVSIWNPTLKQVLKESGNNGIAFYGDSFYTEFFCLASDQDYVRNHPEAVRKVLRALIRAEIFVKQQPEDARRLVADFIQTDKAALDEIWNIFSFRVTLDQAFLVDLEDQTRWAIKNGFTLRKDMPDYLDFIYVDGLHSVKPDAVRIIR